MKMRVLFIGDIVGDPGIEAVAKIMAGFQAKGIVVDFMIANVENIAGGFGVTEKALNKIEQFGIGCFTSGNHIWNRPEAEEILNRSSKLLRPANYPPANPGFGWQLYQTESGQNVAVINLQGRTYMQSIDCPFRAADEILEQIGGRCKIIIVDFHADATSEKQAMGWYLDGRVSAVVGTHTHVQSAEARILPHGTGFITDVGMCGPYDSVIGMRTADALSRFLKGRPERLHVAEGNPKFAGVMMDIDDRSGGCISIERLLIEAQSQAEG